MARRYIPKKKRSPVVAARIPRSLHQKIKNSARSSGRSLSDEMAWILGLSFEQSNFRSVVRRAATNAIKEILELNGVRVSFLFVDAGLNIQIDSSVVQKTISLDAVIEDAIKAVPSLTNIKAIDDSAVAIDELIVRAKRLRDTLLDRLGELKPEELVAFRRRG